ncbi:hypothetical protein FRC02_005155 [Tulasnella sp. 418]|nr:hypothetical protein FRC02_005155 [Tulasnella sp. 418]
MAPKKQQKMSLNAFLGDSTLGSWADEMDSLPTAPAPRNDEDRSRRGERDFGNRFDDYPPRDRESRYPPREELPLPTAPPFTAFVGNLSFDLSEADIEEFFGSYLKSVKIIRDRDDKPKGFGYVEFGDLQGLKDALAKSGGQLSGRTIRVSVAEPPKERSGPGGGFDDDKTAGAWRRDGPLPSNDRGFDRGPRGSGPPPSRYEDNADRGERMGMGSKFVPSGPSDRPPRGTGGPSRFNDAPPSEAETTSDWRSNRPMRPPPPPTERPASGPRRGSGFSTPEGPPHASEVEDTWTKGSKFVPTDQPREKGGFFGKRENKLEEEPSDWRSAPRKSPVPPGQGRQDRSPSGSVPSTPSLSRKKLDIHPRSAQSNATSPISSPKSPSGGDNWRSPNGSQTPTLTSSSTRSNPFGAAKPVDVGAREKEIEARLERSTRSTDTSNDTSIRSPSGGPPKSQERGGWGGTGSSWRDRKGPTSSKPSSTTHSRTSSHDGGKPAAGPASTQGEPKKFRSGFSFAAAAGGLEVAEGEEDEPEEGGGEDVDEVEKKVAGIAV